jgi:hypothetical protein
VAFFGEIRLDGDLAIRRAPLFEARKAQLGRDQLNGTQVPSVR